MGALSIAVLIVEVLFVAITIPIFLAFNHVRHKQEAFFGALQNASNIRLRHTVLASVYLFTTFVLCIGSAAYYLTVFLR